VVLKCLLLCFVPLFWAHRVWLLLAVVVIGSVGSHMPGRFRYFSVARNASPIANARMKSTVTAGSARGRMRETAQSFPRDPSLVASPLL